MSDTPETDAAVNASGGDWSPVLRAVSQRLERERDEAIRQLENIKASSIHTCHDECQRPMCVLRRERDELAALLAAEKATRNCAPHNLAKSEMNCRTLKLSQSEKVRQREGEDRGGIGNPTNPLNPCSLPVAR
jgi:hypothetical protein